MEPQQARQRVTDHDPLLPAERGELVVQRVEPALQLRRVGLGERGVANLVAALDELGREQELPVLGGPVVLDSVQDQKAIVMTVRSDPSDGECRSCIAPMTEAQLRAFVTVAEAGGFGEAARRLHMSQPGVSRAVRALEVELGGELFLRGRGVPVLTMLGERALNRSRAILGETEAMRQERDETRGIASGRVRLGSMPSVSATILPALLSRV